MSIHRVSPFVLMALLVICSHAPAEQASPGRYMVATASAGPPDSPNYFGIVVCDTTTGECRYKGGHSENWRSLGSPAEVKETGRYSVSMSGFGSKDRGFGDGAAHMVVCDTKTSECWMLPFCDSRKKWSKLKAPFPEG